MKTYVYLRKRNDDGLKRGFYQEAAQAFIRDKNKVAWTKKLFSEVSETSESLKKQNFEANFSPSEDK